MCKLSYQTGLMKSTPFCSQSKMKYKLRAVVRLQKPWYLLLYFSVITRAVIGQFCGPYFTARPACFESLFSRVPD